LRKEVGEEVRREIGDERRGEFGGELHDENLCWCAIGKDKSEWVLEELLSARVASGDSGGCDMPSTEAEGASKRRRSRALVRGFVRPSVSVVRAVNSGTTTPIYVYAAMLRRIDVALGSSAFRIQLELGGGTYGKSISRRVECL
jgi:hypothetical protein